MSPTDRVFRIVVWSLFEVFYGHATGINNVFDASELGHIEDSLGVRDLRGEGCEVGYHVQENMGAPLYDFLESFFIVPVARGQLNTDVLELFCLG
ncbi:hypothetical protein HG531_001081 [Fusarium graminearum]|nr:hypothetical protein HG531_001081 [Fusarium graminearum]